MKRTLLQLLAVWVAVFSTSAVTVADEIYYGVYQGAGTLTGFGTGKTESYDVALHLTDPTLVGMEIRTIRFPVNVNAKNATEYTAWLSKALTLESGNNTPDVVSIEVTPDGSWAEVVLSEPYIIEEGGIYAGYSFNVTSLDGSDTNKTPVQTIATENPEGLLIHTSRTYRKWVGLTEVGSPAILVRLGGSKVKQNAAMLEAPENLYTLTGKSITTTLTLVNHGTENIKNFEYEIELNGQVTQKTQTKSLTGGYYGRSSTFSATIPAVDMAGTYLTTFRITKVNGVENEDPLAATVVPVTFLSEIPVHKPLVEEYTGTWCQYCTRALAGMEKMNDKNGENFVGVAYHEDDAMEFSSYYPASPSGLPAVYIDRIASFDPLTGQNDWEKRRSIIAPASISVTGEWEDNAKTKIKATSTTTFIRDFSKSPYRVAYILIANDLHSTDWKQWNAYSGQSSSDPYLDKVCKMSNPIKDYHYNEVALAQSAKNGAALEESLPSDVSEYTPYLHSFEFDISANELPIDKEKLEVIAVLLNTETGEVMNANKGHVTDATGIEQIKNEKLNIKYYYDLSGRKVNSQFTARPEGTLSERSGERIHNSQLAKGVYIKNGKKVVK